MFIHLVWRWTPALSIVNVHSFMYSLSVPKVSEDHRKAQEDRFVDAARRCFTRQGVEGTSMEDIRTEAGVSAGLMYRYFGSKDEMIRAAIAGALAEFEALVEETSESTRAATAAGYLRLLLENLRRFRHSSPGVDLFKLAIQGWAHAQARPKARAVITESFARQMESFHAVATRWTTPRRAPAAGQAIAAAVIGYVVQSAFSDDDIDVAQYCNGLTALGQ
jgi:TetR/AcrR family transcriptional regulator, transcriptional repressor of aconitase